MATFDGDAGNFRILERLQDFDGFSEGFWKNLPGVEQVTTDQNTIDLFVDGFSNDSGQAGEKVGVAFDFPCRVAVSFAEKDIGGADSALMTLSDKGRIDSNESEATIQSERSE